MRRFSPLHLPLLLFLLLAACGGGGGGDENAVPAGDGSPLDEPPIGDPADTPAIARTVPAHGDVNVARTSLVRVEFAVPIDAASVTPDALTLADASGTPVSGTARPLGADVVEFIPAADLAFGDTFVATLHAGIRSQSGDTRQRDFVFAFRAREATPRLALFHEQEPEDMRVYGLELNSRGDGMSLMYESNGANSGLRFRRVRNARPSGLVENLTNGPIAVIPFRSFDVAENGNAQYAWLENRDGGNSAVIRQYDRGTDSWGTTRELTPGALRRGVSVDAHLSTLGGVVAWIERDDGDFDDYRVFAARYDQAQGLRDVTPLGAPTGQKGFLRIERAGQHGVVAFHGQVNGTFRAHAARFDQAGGFGAAVPLDGTNEGRVRDVAASPTGHLYVLSHRENPQDEDQGRWYLAAALPGQGFGAPVPLHQDYNGLGAGTLAVADNGVLTVLYSVAGTESGTWARQYMPGQGFTAPADISGIGRPVAGSLVFDALTVDVNDQGDAVAVAAISTPGGGQTIRAALLPQGRPWTVGIEVADEDDRPTSREAKLVIEPSTGAFIQWVSQIDTQPNPIHYVLHTRRLRADGTLGPVITYGTARTDVIANTHLDMTPEGKGLLVFDKLGDGIGLPNDVFHASID